MITLRARSVRKKDATVASDLHRGAAGQSVSDFTENPGGTLTRLGGSPMKASGNQPETRSLHQDVTRRTPQRRE